jgi:hypothetical protein
MASLAATAVAGYIGLNVLAMFELFVFMPRRRNERVPVSQRGRGPEGAFNLIRKLPIDILRKIQLAADQAQTGLEAIPPRRGGSYAMRRPDAGRHRYRPY